MLKCDGTVSSQITLEVNPGSPSEKIHVRRQRQERCLARQSLNTKAWLETSFAENSASILMFHADPKFRFLLGASRQQWREGARRAGISDEAGGTDALFSTLVAAQNGERGQVGREHTGRDWGSKMWEESVVCSNTL